MEDINVRSVRYPVVVDQKFEKFYQNAGKYAARTDQDINGQNRRIAAADY
jgi:hypothetical protein